MGMILPFTWRYPKDYEPRRVLLHALTLLCSISCKSAGLDALLSTSPVPTLIAILQYLPARGPAFPLTGNEDKGYSTESEICGHSDSLRRHCLELGVYPLLQCRLGKCPKKIVHPRYRTVVRTVLMAIFRIFVRQLCLGGNRIPYISSFGYPQIRSSTDASPVTSWQWSFPG
jgi:hypothetical protein